MATVEFTLNVSRDDMLVYYAGYSSQVVVCSDDGIWVQFPANQLRAFVNHDGVHGRFRLYYDESGRFARLQRL